MVSWLMGWSWPVVLLAGRLVSALANSPAWDYYAVLAALAIGGSLAGRWLLRAARPAAAARRDSRRRARALTRRLRKAGMLGSPAQASFGDGGLQLTVAWHDILLGWESVRGVKESPSGLVLELAPGPWAAAAYVPSRALGGEAGVRRCAEFCSSRIRPPAPAVAQEMAGHSGAVLLWAAGCMAWWWALLFCGVAWVGGLGTAVGALWAIAAALLCWLFFHAGLAALLGGPAFDLPPLS